MNIGRTIRVFRAEPVLSPVPGEPATEDPADRRAGPAEPVAAGPEPVPAGVRAGADAAPPQPGG